ncbi:Macrophage migration inhibitory factor family protein [Spironucleus salmonicida]|uniref:Macrophage migration inhibitory factor family protein n=1 Tax=Spironucleus salmonicida TaxID=348837 RepID=V6LKY1_9EUKA|nr:Macrophage migration inhibitory factor family protein [Spironucleus salmonicida]|eukprot:EST45023.1 Macrophage migration inhibitory factor family protein [Spironucleus salmonicida]
MAQVAVYTNLELPGILDFIKNCVADSTGRQEPTVFVSLNRLQSFKFGTSKEGIFIKVNFVGAADVYRTQKTLQYLCQKLVYKYNILGELIYINFIETNRNQVYIDGEQM